MAKWGASFIQRAAGYDFTRPQLSTRFSRVLQRMQAFAPDIGTVVDVGASTGSWSKSITPTWPNARYLLIEAQDVHRPALREYATASPGVVVEHAAASDRTGSLHFLSNGPLAGSASHERFGDNDIEVPCVSIDDAVERHHLPGPYLIKLDTHGHEREILAGATKTLQNTGLLCIEAYNFANFGRMTFWELCTFLEERGFRPAGMSDPLVREADDLLWQLDMWFLPASHRAFADTTWDGTSAGRQGSTTA